MKRIGAKVWPVCKKRVPRSVMREIAWECFARHHGGDAPRVECPAGEAGHCLYAVILGVAEEGAYSTASALMGLAEEGDFRP